MKRSFTFGRKNKYKAKPADGFGSLLERAVYYRLVDRQLLGEITDIKRQQAVLLSEVNKDGSPKEDGERRRWKVDFSAVEVATGRTVYFEAKGYETNDYIRKRNLWRKNPPARLEIWKGTHQRLRLVEVIDPKYKEGGE